jgi:NADPH2:quinone reductase
MKPAGETVLITAASGGVGTAAVQIARSIGARVVAVASERNHGYVRDLGSEAAVDEVRDQGLAGHCTTARPSKPRRSSSGTG